MTKVITINETSITNGTTYYHIHIKIPLRSLTVIRRYSEFVDLVKSISNYLGIDIKDFPYSLPPKSSFFTKNSASTIEERKSGLEEFMNLLVNDREIQNTPLLHEFLQLPAKFKFTANLLQSKSDNITDLVITDINDIDSLKWLEYLRLFRSHVNQLIEKFNENNDITTKHEIRNKIINTVKPNLIKLKAKLEQIYKSNGFDELEYQRRLLLVKELEHEMDAITQVTSLKPTMPGSFEKPESKLNGNSRRVLGYNPVETETTMPLNNQELLQQQIQVHKSQDQELEELRKIIARQKQIGLTINQEVEEQNELLESLNDQVDITTNKLRSARNKARNVI